MSSDMVQKTLFTFGKRIRLRKEVSESLESAIFYWLPFLAWEANKKYYIWTWVLISVVVAKPYDKKWAWLSNRQQDKYDKEILGSFIIKILFSPSFIKV